MRKRKLKAYVLPTVYTCVVMVIFASMMFMNASLNVDVDEEEKESVVESNYVIDVIESGEVPVVSEVDNTVGLPYSGTDIEIEVDYYSKDDEAGVQEDSLIYYSNTYMQNTGIVYGSDEVFDITAVLSGTVKNISEDEILGQVIEIEHANGYTSFYYSTSDISVSVGDAVSKGDIIAKSGTCALEDIEENNLLFEVYFEGKTIDPNSFYELIMES